MKNFILLLAVLCCLQSYAGAEKKGLIVAVGDYPRSGGWPKISSDKDVPLIVNALHHHLFEDENILILRDSLATKKGIIEGLKKLTRDANQGDIIVFHYSGHGQQMRDLSGDELDGRDETIVPFDAPIKFVKNEYEGERHLSDDELELLLGELRLKLGSSGSLTVIFDACHSGTATRGAGMAPARGTDIFMGPPDWKGKQGRDSTTYDTEVKSRGSGEQDLAPMVLFSGASADQLNYETYDEQGNSVGSLSFALSKILLNVSKSSTYQEVFDQVRIEMSVLAPRQTPRIEGAVNQVIFGGHGVNKPAYFLNSQVIDGKTSILNAGTLSGLYNKSKVALYPAGIEDISKSEPLSRGLIANANLINCDVLWEKELDPEVIRKGFVYLISQNYEGLKIRVDLQVVDDSSLLYSLQKNIQPYQNIIEVTNRAAQIVIAKSAQKTRGAEMLEVVTNNNEVIMTESILANTELVSSKVVRTLLQYTQAQFLRELNTQNPEISLEIHLIPITEVEWQTTGEGRYKKTRLVEKGRDSIGSKMVNGMIELDSGDHFKIQIKNTGNDVAYFTLIDITSDNEVAVVIPRKNEPSAEFKIRPGETLEIDRIYTITPPYGTETFKLISSLEPLDLRNVVLSRGEASPSNNPLEKLVQKSYLENSRGLEDETEEVQVPSDLAHITTLLFKIK